MPTPEQILAGLHQIANQWQMLAIFWHLYLGVLVLSFAFGWRPSKRVVGILLSVPLLSVSVLAWMLANPFNGLVFAVVGVALLVVAARLPDEPIHFAPSWALGMGILMFVFGWVYPHFLDTESLLPYLYAAPMGLIPCPTLSIVIGISLMLEGLGSRAWSLVLGLTGVFYGLFGALRLGVAIDLILLVGALLLIMVCFISTAGIRKSALAH